MEHVPGKFLEVQRLAEALGSVAEACRRLSYSRATYYRERERLLEHEQGGFEPKPRGKVQGGRVQHPHQQRLVETSLEHPGWSAARLAEWMTGAGTRISGTTAHRLLRMEGMSRPRGRRLRLEERLREDPSPTAEQRAFLGRYNPVWRDAPYAALRQGQVLHQEIIAVGVRVEPERALHLHVAVDEWGGYVMAALTDAWVGGMGFEDGEAHDFMADLVLPFYEQRGHPAQAVESGSSPLLRPEHATRLHSMLADRGVTIVPRPAKGPRHGLVERFWKEIGRDFRSQARRLPEESASLEHLRGAVAVAVDRFNGETRLEGYPYYGRTPCELSGFGSSAPGC